MNNINLKKKYRKPYEIFLYALGVTAALLILTVLLAYLFGFRYLSVKTADGTIRFIGRVDAGGALESGTLYYSDGKTGKIYSKTSTVKYSDGSVYEGVLVNLQKSGKGKITYDNGDTYEGEFSKDKTLFASSTT